MPTVHPPDKPIDEQAQEGVTRPAYRPVERLWPYAELPESPTPEELAELDPELHSALFGSPPRPFSVTLEFSRLDQPAYDRAIAIARASAEYREVGRGDAVRHRARFYAAGVRQMHALYEIVGPRPDTEVLIDDNPVPYGRELWLPLFWLVGLREPPADEPADPSAR